MDMYIYYRVTASRASALQAQASAMQANLSRQCGIAAALKRRPEEKDGLHTWMEVYLAVPKDFDSTLDSAVRASQLPLLIEGERHTEYFLDLSSCV